MRRTGIILLSAILLAATCKAAGATGYIPGRGTVHIPVIILEFQDVRFSVEDPAAHFASLLGEEGYSENGATGSVRDYYLDNSGGVFNPVFDVYGPVTLPNRMSYYGRDIIVNGERVDDCAPEQALIDACALLDEEVDFSVYDNDSDGMIDLVIFYFAGYDQAEGGPADAIWSHHWNVNDGPEGSKEPEYFYDGLAIGGYFCASELRGKDGGVPGGIGPSCHELAHTLGLPDFYDVNGAMDGYAGGVYDYSLMGNGLYNNGGRTPPYLGALERMLLGWREEIPELPEGTVTIGPVQEGEAYRISTSTEGEYFILESRSGTGWDVTLPEGLLLYHVDRSGRMVGDRTAESLWEDWRAHNGINNYGDHPCYYVVPSSDPSSLYFASAFNASSLVFPGTVKRLGYEPVDWEGEFCGVQLSCISWVNGTGVVRVIKDCGRNVNGTVLNSSLRPVPGVNVSLTGSDREAETDEQGFFLIPLDEEEGRGVLEFSKSGYSTVNESFTLEEGTRMDCISVIIRTPGEAKTNSLSKYDPSGTSAYFPNPSAIGAVRFRADELSPLAGRQVSRIDCFPYISFIEEDVGDMYVTVDFGPVRVLSKKVENPSLGEFRKVTADISEENIRIPEGVDVYIGYGFSGSSANFPLSAVYPGGKGNSYWSGFSLEESSWNEMYSAPAGQYMDLMLSADAIETPAGTLAELGYATIDTGAGHYRSGDLFEPSLNLPAHTEVSEVEWYWDGLKLKGGAFRLTQGEHQLKAYVSYSDGRREMLRTMVKVN